MVMVLLLFLIQKYKIKRQSYDDPWIYNKTDDKVTQWSPFDLSEAYMLESAF